MFEFFIEEGKKLYGNDIVTYNVHCLYHISDIAATYGGLQTINVYPFENNMNFIKRKVHSDRKHIIQLARRLREMEMDISLKSHINLFGSYRDIL